MSSHLDSNKIPPSRQRELPRQGLTWIGQSIKRVEDPRIWSARAAISTISLCPGWPMRRWSPTRMPMPGSSA